MGPVSLRIWLGGAIVATLAVCPVRAADSEHGRQLFIACAACHSDRPGALGPSLKGVVGRKAGAREDFRYSNSMRRADFVWNEANLREYLADPQAKVKGNRMPFSGLRDAKDIEDVIAYLATLK
jgi:cytochrome c